MAELSKEYAAVRLAVTDAGTNGEETLLLPRTSRAEDVGTLVIVAVSDAFARIGSTRAATDDEMRAAAAALSGSARPVALIRVDDSARLMNVVRVARAMRLAGFGVRVLGSVAPSEPAPDRPWEDCPSPVSESGAASVVVQVLVDDDGTGRPGVVHVLRSPGVPFAWSAAVCASMQSYAPSAAPPGRPRFGVRLNMRFVD